MARQAIKSYAIDPRRLTIRKRLIGSNQIACDSLVCAVGIKQRNIGLNKNATRKFCMPMEIMKRMNAKMKLILMHLQISYG